MRSCHSLHTHKSPYPPSGRVGDVVAMLQIKFLGIGNHGVAEATGFQRSKGIFLAPHPVDFIEILGADGSIRFQSDVSLRLHEIKDIVVVTLDRFPVFPDTVRELLEETGIKKSPEDLIELYRYTDDARHCIYYGYLNVCDDEEHVKLQQGETMDYMYMPYEEFIDFIMSERFIPSEQRRFKLHSEHIVKQIKQACMVQ